MQICKISPIIMDLSFFVCVRVSECYNRSHRSHHSEDLKCKITFFRFRHLPSNGVIAKIALHDLDLVFRGNKFEIVISRTEPAQKCMGYIVDLKFVIEWRNYET